MNASSITDTDIGMCRESKTMTDDGTKPQKVSGDSSLTPEAGGELVAVIVGGQEFGIREFKANSHLLRAFSGYFDGGFRSGMKESQEMRFEFPGRDPVGFGLMLKILDPFDKEVVSTSNYQAVLPWFDFLSISKGLEQCDKFISSECYARLPPYSYFLKFETVGTCGEELHQILDYLDQSIQYGLPESKRTCTIIVAAVIEQAQHVQGDEEFHHEMWPLLQEHLPPSLANDQQKAEILFSNNMLPGILHSQLEIKEKLKILERKMNRVVEVISQDKEIWYVRELRIKLKKDSVCGDLFSKDGGEPSNADSIAHYEDEDSDSDSDY